MDVLSVTRDMLFLCFLFFSFRMNSDIVHVYRQPTLRYLGSEDGIHHHLEGGRGVCEAKEHDCRFEQSFWGKESGFPFVAFFNTDVIIPPSNVDFCKESASS